MDNSRTSNGLQGALVKSNIPNYCDLPWVRSLSDDIGYPPLSPITNYLPQILQQASSIILGKSLPLLGTYVSEEFGL